MEKYRKAIYNNNKFKLSAPTCSGKSELLEIFRYSR